MTELTRKQPLVKLSSSVSEGPSAGERLWRRLHAANLVRRPYSKLNLVQRSDLERVVSEWRNS